MVVQMTRDVIGFESSIPRRPAILHSTEPSLRRNTASVGASTMQQRATAEGSTAARNGHTKMEESSVLVFRKIGGAQRW